MQACIYIHIHATAFYTVCMQKEEEQFRWSIYDEILVTLYIFVSLIQPFAACTQAYIMHARMHCTLGNILHFKVKIKIHKKYVEMHILLLYI